MNRYSCFKSIKAQSPFTAKDRLPIPAYLVNQSGNPGASFWSSPDPAADIRSLIGDDVKERPKRFVFSTR
jgi:hypothetical protein